MGYSTLFWVPETIFVASDRRCTVSGRTSKLVVFAFLHVFVGSHCFGCRRRFSGPVTPGLRLQGQRENSSFSLFWPFSWAIAHCFGCRRRFSGPVTPGSRFQGRRQTRHFRVFWPFTWAIAHCFGCRGRFSGPVTPGSRFQGRRPNSSFSGRFRGL